MKKTILIGLLFLVVLSGKVLAQDSLAQPRRNHYSLAVGLGFNHYFNTLQIAKDFANPNSGTVSFRFFWEPEHLLSLGLETGYFRLFKVEKKISSESTSTATMDIVPLFLLVRMRVVNYFYVTVGMGLAMMINKVSLDRNINSTFFSLSNFKFGASYLHPVGKNFFAGVELGTDNIGKTNDWTFSAQVVGGIRIP